MSYSTKLFGKRVNASVTGPDGGTYNQEQNRPNLVGKPNETKVLLDKIEVLSLLDTGSCAVWQPEKAAPYIAHSAVYIFLLVL